jgi:hypothetical protein
MLVSKTMPNTTAETPDWLREMETIFEELNEGVVVVDHQLRVIFANEALTRMGRFERNEIQGCTPESPKLAAASFVQRLMHQANRRRSFADCRRHALDVARAYIANRKHARQTGLENIRTAPQRPACAGEIFRRQIWSSLDKALLILNNTSFEPSRVRASSGHHENVPDVVSL